jgi:L-histidine N-alpha-methyltransferase
MTYQDSGFCEHITIDYNNYRPHIDNDEIARDILSGLTRRNKHISCKYFYDAIGSKLFEEITRLPEYYLTRVEKRLLNELSLHIGNKLANTDIIELGSGDCSKISILLAGVPARDIASIRYIPVDVSHAAIKESANILNTLFPGLRIHGLIADFTSQLSGLPEEKKRLFCFLGSTIGNFSRSDSIALLKDIGGIMQTGDMLLVGFDMVKDVETIETAYNDSSRVTEAFNKNILHVANTLAGTDFNPDDFGHVAFYNEEYSRIEMHLRALDDLVITSPHLAETIFIERGETIHTENSHKYTDKRIKELASHAGLSIHNTYRDQDNWFSLIQLRK